MGLWQWLAGKPEEPTPVASTPPPAPPALPPKDPDEDELAYITRLARAQLPPDVATRWLSLLRPAIRLGTAGPGQPVLARLGGRPRLPDDVGWPTWEGHGPLSFVGEVDLVAVAASPLDPGITLPTTGRLLAFYFDGSYDDFASIVGTWDRESLAGARLLHVASTREECAERATPEGVLEYAGQDLEGSQVTTFPNWEHPVLRRAFGAPEDDHRAWMDHPVNDDAFAEALWALHDDAPRHQLGGWAAPVQGPVELEVAEAALDPSVGDADDARLQEALQWSLVWQVDSDDASEMMWGDVGALYWLTRGTSTASGLGPVSFTWQCS